MITNEQIEEAIESYEEDVHAAPHPYVDSCLRGVNYDRLKRFALLAGQHDGHSFSKEFESALAIIAAAQDGDDALLETVNA